MRKLPGVGAVAFGTIGVLLSVAAIGIGWRTAVRVVKPISLPT